MMSLPTACPLKISLLKEKIIEVGALLQQCEDLKNKNCDKSVIEKKYLTYLKSLSRQYVKLLGEKQAMESSLEATRSSFREKEALLSEHELTIQRLQQLIEIYKVERVEYGPHKVNKMEQKVKKLVSLVMQLQKQRLGPFKLPLWFYNCFKKEIRQYDKSVENQECTFGSPSWSMSSSGTSESGFDSNVSSPMSELDAEASSSDITIQEFVSKILPPPFVEPSRVPGDFSPSEQVSEEKMKELTPPKKVSSIVKSPNWDTSLRQSILHQPPENAYEDEVIFTINLKETPAESPIYEVPIMSTLGNFTSPEKEKALIIDRERNITDDLPTLGDDLSQDVTKSCLDITNNEIQKEENEFTTEESENKTHSSLNEEKFSNEHDSLEREDSTNLRNNHSEEKEILSSSDNEDLPNLSFSEDCSSTNNNIISTITPAEVPINDQQIKITNLTSEILQNVNVEEQFDIVDAKNSSNEIKTKKSSCEIFGSDSEDLPNLSFSKDCSSTNNNIISTNTSAEVLTNDQEINTTTLTSEILRNVNVEEQVDIVDAINSSDEIITEKSSSEFGMMIERNILSDAVDNGLLHTWEKSNTQTKGKVDDKHSSERKKRKRSTEMEKLTENGTKSEKLEPTIGIESTREEHQLQSKNTLQIVNNILVLPENVEENQDKPLLVEETSTELYTDVVLNNLNETIKRSKNGDSENDLNLLDSSDCVQEVSLEREKTNLSSEDEWDTPDSVMAEIFSLFRPSNQILSPIPSIQVRKIYSKIENNCHLIKRKLISEEWEESHSKKLQVSEDSYNIGKKNKLASDPEKATPICTKDESVQQERRGESVFSDASEIIDCLEKENRKAKKRQTKQRAADHIVVKPAVSENALSKDFVESENNQLRMKAEETISHSFLEIENRETFQIEKETILLKNSPVQRILRKRRSSSLSSEYLSSSGSEILDSRKINLVSPLRKPQVAKFKRKRHLAKEIHSLFSDGETSDETLTENDSVSPILRRSKRKKSKTDEKLTGDSPEIPIISATPNVKPKPPSSKILDYPSKPFSPGVTSRESQSGSDSSQKTSVCNSSRPSLRTTRIGSVNLPSVEDPSETHGLTNGCGTEKIQQLEQKHLQKPTTLNDYLQKSDRSQKTSVCNSLRPFFQTTTTGSLNLPSVEDPSETHGLTNGCGTEKIQQLEQKHLQEPTTLNDYLQKSDSSQKTSVSSNLRLPLRTTRTGSLNLYSVEVPSKIHELTNDWGTEKMQQLEQEHLQQPTTLNDCFQKAGISQKTSVCNSLRPPLRTTRTGSLNLHSVEDPSKTQRLTNGCGTEKIQQLDPKLLQKPTTLKDCLQKSTETSPSTYKFESVVENSVKENKALSINPLQSRNPATSAIGTELMQERWEDAVNVARTRASVRIASNSFPVETKAYVEEVGRNIKPSVLTDNAKPSNIKNLWQESRMMYAKRSVFSSKEDVKERSQQTVFNSSSSIYPSSQPSVKPALRSSTSLEQRNVEDIWEKSRMMYTKKCVISSQICQKESSFSNQKGVFNTSNIRESPSTQPTLKQASSSSSDKKKHNSDSLIDNILTHMEKPPEVKNLNKNVMTSPKKKKKKGKKKNKGKKSPVKVDVSSSRCRQFSDPMEEVAWKALNKFLTADNKSVEDAERETKSCLSVLTPVPNTLLVKAIVNIVLENVDEELDWSFSPRSPPLTPTQQRLFALFKRSSRFPPLYLNLLDAVHAQLLPDTFKLFDDSIRSCARFHVALCRLLDQPETAIRFCVDVAKMMPQRGCLIINDVLSSWPEIVPKAENAKPYGPGPTLAMIVMLTPLPKRISQESSLRNLKKLLADYYGYSREVDLNTWGKEALTALRGGDGNAGAAIVAVGSRNWEWLASSVVSPLLETLGVWQYGGLSDDIACMILSVLSRAIGQYPDRSKPREQKREAVQRLGQILLSSKVSHIGEEAILQLILKQNSKRTPFKSILEQWVPKKPVTEIVLKRLQSALVRKETKQPNVPVVQKKKKKKSKNKTRAANADVDQPG